MIKNFITKKGIYVFTAGLLVFMIFAGFENQPEADKQKTAMDHHEDMGNMPWVLDIEEATVDNDNYRATKWTGKHMQMVLMSLKPGETIDLEIHDGLDQFIRIEQGEARVRMGKSEDNLDFDKNVSDDWALFIPAGYWHQVINTGNTDLKLYTIYSPMEHPAGTVNKTYEDAREYHHEHHHDH